MKLDELTEIYDLISRGTENSTSRKEASSLRKVALSFVSSGQGFNKVAFDTRRINQETEYNPRRGLQNYNRSQSFISEAMTQKIQNFAKLRNALVDLKDQYGREPEWQDSNTRVLLGAIDTGLRVITKDGDYTDTQPGIGSFDYLEELLHVRYRLSFDDLTRMDERELKKVVLAKDDDLTRKNVSPLEISKQDISKHSYSDLLEKLFASCRASAENPDVERTVTITIRDKFHKES